MKSIPKGYKKTEVGIIPEEWETTRLGHLFDFLYGKQLPSHIVGHQNYPVYGTNGPFKTVNSYLFNGESIIVGRKGAIRAIHYAPSDAWVIDTAFYSVQKRTICMKAIYYRMSLIDLSQMDSGSAIPSTNKQELENIRIALPPLREQEAIAEVLSGMDALIEAQKELIAKKRAIKQGTMQDLLSGRVRLPGYETKGWKHTDIGDIPDDWEVKSFSNIAYLIKETVDPTSNKSLNCVELEHLSSSTGLLIDFDDLSDKSSFKNKFQREDVLFGKLRSYLRKFWLCQWSGCCSTEIWVFRPKSITNSVFLKYIVSSDQFVKVASESFGTHMPRADWNVVKECFFAIPALYSEQQAMAQVLSDMDDELETLEAELEKLNHMKRGMMQELLTGRIRLI